MISRETDFYLTATEQASPWKRYSSFKTLKSAEGVLRVNGKMVFVLVTSETTIYFVQESRASTLIRGYEITCKKDRKNRGKIILGEATGKRVLVNRNTNCYKLY